MKTFGAIILLIGTAVCMVSCDGDSKHIKQLCDSDKDEACLKKYFSDNGKCSPVDSPKRSVYYEQKLPIFVPALDVVAVVLKEHLAQLEGDIVVAYKDEESGEIVISIQFDGLYIHAPDTIFAISRNAEEPKVFTTGVNATYPVTLTAVIPAKDGITSDSMANAAYSAYIPNTDADIMLGPGFTESDDPLVINVVKGLEEHLGVALEEIFLTKASYYFLAYFQNAICDFNLPPVLNHYDLTVLKRGNNIDTAKKSDHKNLCESSDDYLKCARDYFRENAQCSVIDDVDGDSVDRRKFLARLPRLNVTAITNDAKITFNGGKVTDLYMSTQTGNVVMNIAFDDIILYSKLTNLILYQEGEEPSMISDHTTCHYPVALTIVIPKDGKITTETIGKSYVSAYFAKDDATIELGPKFHNSKDPQVQQIVKEVNEIPTGVAKEAFLTEGYDMVFAYIQKYICDFKIPISIA